MGLFAAIGFIIGLAFGSFIDAVAGRLINNRSILGRSYCESCKKPLRWYDLFPVFSYLFLKGRCRYCQKKIPRETLVTELAVAGVTAIFFTYFVYPLWSTVYPWADWLKYTDISFGLFVLIVLALVFLIDLKTGLILDKVTFPAIFISLGYLIFSQAVRSYLFYLALKSSELGKYLLPPRSNYLFDQLSRLWIEVGWAILTGVGLSLFFWLIIILTRGKGMGWGDVKYVLFLGLVLGFPNGILAVFLAFVIGAVVSIGLLLFGQKKFGATIPFGPFLSLGGFLALVWGNKIINWYLSFKLGY